MPICCHEMEGNHNPSKVSVISDFAGQLKVGEITKHQGCYYQLTFIFQEKIHDRNCILSYNCHFISYVLWLPCEKSSSGVPVVLEKNLLRQKLERLRV